MAIEARFTAAKTPSGDVAAVASGGKQPALDLLSALVDKSLIARAADRYHLLPTLRRYAAEKVDGRLLPAVRRALVGHFAGLVAELERQLLVAD